MRILITAGTTSTFPYKYFFAAISRDLVEIFKALSIALDWLQLILDTTSFILAAAHPDIVA